MIGTPALLENFPATLPVGMDFKALLAEAIAYCQATVGDTWTDYNEHDPGLTILEQLCYALSDLGMRAQYSVADLLTDAQGRLARDTLFTGDQILCSAPLTSDDYKKYLYDRVRGLKNFWLDPIDGMPGQYRGLIEKFRWGDSVQLCAQVASLLRANRTLCEDVASVLVSTQKPLQLEGVIQLQPGCDADEVMGAVLFDLDLKLLPSPTARNIDTQDSDKVRWDEIYEGPSLECGTIDTSKVTRHPKQITLQQIASVVQMIDGVQALRGLRFKDNSSAMSLAVDEVPFVEIPEQGNDWLFKVIDASGNTMTLNAQRVTRFFLKCESALRSQETAVALSSKTLSYRRLPAGRYLDVAAYASIQFQFPITYGLNPYSMPGDFAWYTSADTMLSANYGDQRTALTQQLRGYLLPFEQVLSNAFAQLANVRHLFSLRQPQAQSYFYQSLINDAKTDPPGTLDLIDQTQIVQPRTSRWRYVVKLYLTPGLSALSSVPLESRQEALQLAESIAQQAVAADNYQLLRAAGQDISIILTDSHGQPLAHSQDRYRTLEEAQTVVGQWTETLRLAIENGARAQHLRIRRRGAIGMQVLRKPGELVLSAYWPGTLDERAAHVDKILEHAAHLSNYRFRELPNGAWRFLVVGASGRKLADGQVHLASFEAIERYARAVAHLIRNIHTACKPRAYLRHVQLFPGSVDLPPPPPSPKETYLAYLKQLVARFDPSAQRRNDFLNHLLARFDEQFDDAALQAIDPRPVYDDTFQNELAGWKNCFLATYRGTSARRGKGFNYGLKTLQTLPFGSGLEHRLYSLLGIGGQHHFARHPRSRPQLTAQRPYFDFVRRPQTADASPSAPPENSFVFANNSPGLLADLLHCGTDLARYEIKETSNQPGLALYFRLPGGSEYAILTDSDKARLQHYRNTLIAWLKADGGAQAHVYDGEGLYLLEHLLLRPMASAAPTPDEFYGYRLSVLLPDWPVRFQNDDFKRLLSKLLNEHCPAHIAVDYHWLDFASMQQFETDYAAWAAEKYRTTCLSTPDYTQLDQHSQALREFLQQRQPAAAS